MAESILIVSTPPGRFFRHGQLRVGHYSALFLYRLVPPILDQFDVKVAPTPLAGLVQVVGQAWVDRYIQPEEVVAFDAGDAAWEFITGQRVTVRDVEYGPLRLETTLEMITRLQADWAAKKIQSMADWTVEYQFTGRRIAP